MLYEAASIDLSVKSFHPQQSSSAFLSIFWVRSALISSSSGNMVLHTVCTGKTAGWGEEEAAGLTYVQWQDENITMSFFL